jgi:dihydroflavonol-4-reductase
MDVAITGATGHVGASLVRAILAQGRSVRVLARNDLRAIQGLDVEIITGDVLQPDSLMKLFKGVQTVFHLAAKISIVGSEGGMVEKINIEGTKNVIDACIKNGVKRLVHFSSIHAFSSHPKDEVIDETRPLATDKHEFYYDRSKAIAQMAVKDAVRRGLSTVILNPTGIIGPYDFKISRMGGVLLDIYHCRYPALIDGGYDWVDSRDVVACALAAETKGRDGESYLVSGHWYHVCDIAQSISEIYCKKTPRFATPIWLCSLPSYCVLALSKMRKVTPKFTPQALKTLQSHRYISHEKATRELGHRPRPVEDTIRDTLDWFKAQGVLDPACK